MTNIVHDLPPKSNDGATDTDYVRHTQAGDYKLWVSKRGGDNEAVIAILDADNARYACGGYNQHTREAYPTHAFGDLEAANAYHDELVERSVTI